MELQYQESKNGIRLIKLIGKLDMSGVKNVESQLVANCAGNQVKVMVDLSELDFLTSSGGELLLWNAKEVISRRGKFVLLNPILAVEKVLEETGIKEWCPIYSSFDIAASYLSATKVI